MEYNLLNALAMNKKIINKVTKNNRKQQNENNYRFIYEINQLYLSSCFFIFKYKNHNNPKVYH